jgi:hypothetical protein
MLFQDNPTDEIKYYDIPTLELSARRELSIGEAGTGSKPWSFTLFALLKMLAEYVGSSAKHSANKACIRRWL